MKTAISLPDALFKEADAEAKRRGVSRSQLYGEALSEFLARSRSENITARLNEVYAKHDSRLPKGAYELQRRAVGKDNW
ncbi:MAG: hypothetical protein FJW38_02330 [Acidobacteria bacterium]|nr:hypothetical protein [Acidobacteriota bacterium]